MNETYYLMLVARFGEHTRNAICGFVLDYLAFKIGRLWLIGAAALIVQNGRLVFFFALLPEWLLGVEDTSFVFSITLLIVHIAHPLVFNDTNIPTAEIWYDFCQTGVPTLPIFVFQAWCLHYPRWTTNAIYTAVCLIPSFAISLLDVSVFYNLVWTVIKWAFYMFVYVGIYIHAGPTMQAWVVMTWRWYGRMVYEIRASVITRLEAGLTIASRREQENNLTEFVHGELDSKTQIRLLQILPRGNSDTLRCKMLHAELEDLPIYEAISYTWGDPKQCKTILIDDKLFPTTQNVYNLLYDRSPIFSPRTIWIDSICINQRDDEEKSWQVQLMTEIYEHASRVTVWLGLAHNAHLANGLLLELAYLIKHYAPSDQELFDKYHHQRRSMRFLALGDMLELSYFTRVWMVQEVSVNKTIHVVYGGQLINWDTLTSVVTTILMANNFSLLVEDSAVVGRKRTRLLNGASLILLNKVRAAVQQGDRPDLADLLVWCLPFQSTDSRDKLYALWSLAIDGYDALVTPNYSKSTTQVYIDIGSYLVLHDNAILRVFCCAGIGWKRNTVGLPSWIPDWTAGNRALLAYFPKFVNPSSYRASGDLAPSTCRILNDDKLELDTIVLDTIQYIGSEFERPLVPVDGPQAISLALMPERFLPWVHEARDLVMQSLGDSYLPTGQSKEDAFWRTLVADVATYAVGGDRTFARPAPNMYGAYYNCWMDGFVGIESAYASYKATGGGMPVPLSDWIRQSAFWVNDAQFRCMSRRIAISRNGFMGLVPPETKPGDHIAIIPSISTPYIIRPVPKIRVKDRKDFCLVGECYVHGLMDGQGADQAMVERTILH